MSKSKLSPVSWIELVRRLRKLGFDGPCQGGNKRIYKRNLIKYDSMHFSEPDSLE